MVWKLVQAKRTKVERLQDVGLVKSSKYIKTSGGYVLAMLKDKLYVKIQGKLMLTERIVRQF